MKKITIYTLVIATLLLVGTHLSSCEKCDDCAYPCSVVADVSKVPSTPITDPTKAIIGKWATIKSATDTTLVSTVYGEFMPDSIYHLQNIKNSTYWLSDTILYIRYEGSLKAETYYYRFLDFNRLELLWTTYPPPFSSPSPSYSKRVKLKCPNP